MRKTDALPSEVRLALLRDALAILDPKRHPGQRAETAAVLCEVLVAEGLRSGARGLIAEAATRAATTIASGPLPAGPRTALLAVLADSVTLLAAGARSDGDRARVAPAAKPARHTTGRSASSPRITS